MKTVETLPVFSCVGSFCWMLSCNSSNSFELVVLVGSFSGACLRLEGWWWLRLSRVILFGWWLLASVSRFSPSGSLSAS
jgi:hypothetical protein